MSAPTRQFFVYVDWTKEPVPRAYYVGKGDVQRVLLLERNDKHSYVRRHLGCRREIIVVTSSEWVALELECDAIAEYHTYIHDPQSNDVACNFTLGGDGACGWVPSEETRRKISVSKSGKPQRPDVAEQSRQIVLKIANDPEVQRKKSEALRGKLKSPEHREKIRQAHLGLKPSDETRRKMSKSQQRRRHKEQS